MYIADNAAKQNCGGCIFTVTIVLCGMGRYYLAIIRPARGALYFAMNFSVSWNGGGRP